MTHIYACYKQFFQLVSVAENWFESHFVSTPKDSCRLKAHILVNTIYL